MMLLNCGFQSRTRCGPALERADHVCGRNILPLGVLGVGDGVADDVLEENFEHVTRLLVDKARNTLDYNAPDEPPDGRLGDVLDVIAQNLSVPLGLVYKSPTSVAFIKTD